MISVYNNEIQINVGPRKLEILKKYSAIVIKGRKDPVWFIEHFLDVQLTDYQKWIIMSSWTKKTVCLVCSRNTGKSFIASLYIMTRALLFPSQKIWIMSGNAEQSKTTFKKMEDIAKHNIQSVHNDNCIFANEVIRGNANSDGFLHDKESARCTLYNGSTITTLVGRAESVIGNRSNLSVYDEAGIISEEFFARTEPFTTQASDFATGTNIDIALYPPNIPNQNLYLSSASSTQDHLFAIYKDCAMRMMMGYDDSFVADINCEIPLNPTINGEKYPPLFDRRDVEKMMRTNPYRGLREYYNLFDQLGGSDVVVSRDTVLRNEKAYLPVFKNHGEEGVIYGIFFDPALQADNAFVLVCQFFRDQTKGWMMRLVNGINLVQTLPNGDKKPMRSTEQLEAIKNLILDYNGEDAEEYVNLHVSIDPGSGGGGRIYADNLIQNWVDINGRIHHGIYDEEDETSVQDAVKFPYALPGVLSLPSAQKYKSEMFAALEDLAKEDLIIFTKPLPTNGQIEIDETVYDLNPEEVRALLELDLVKEELWLMRKTKTDSGYIKYALQADRARNTKDDRCYTLSMASFYLAKLRRDDTFGGVAQQDMSVLIGRPQHNEQTQQRVVSPVRKNNIPFANNVNPFARKR